MPYRHLTLEDRRTIFRLLNAQVPVEEIADQLGRPILAVARAIPMGLTRMAQYRPLSESPHALWCAPEGRPERGQSDRRSDLEPCPTVPATEDAA